MITLQQALAQNQNVIGANFENLGRGKIYLSFGQAGWSVKRFDGCLGFIQRILRWLGMYSDTYLKGVALQIQREANVPAPLLAKINNCWMRHGGPIAPVVAAPAPVAAGLPLVNEAKVRVVPDPSQDNRFGFYVGADMHTHFSVEEGDITRVRNVTAIVNAANETCLGGGAVDRAIHQAAGDQLLAECQQLPEIRPNVRCETGQAKITKSGLLGQRTMRDMIVQRIIHAVGPRYDAANPAESARLLKQTYVSALDLAHANGIRSIAFPAISTGAYGYPFEDATRLATLAIEEYIVQNPGRFNEIKLLFVGIHYRMAREAWIRDAHPGVRDNFMQ